MVDDLVVSDNLFSLSLRTINIVIDEFFNHQIYSLKNCLVPPYNYEMYLYEPSPNMKVSMLDFSQPDVLVEFGKNPVISHVGQKKIRHYKPRHYGHQNCTRHC